MLDPDTKAWSNTASLIVYVISVTSVTLVSLALLATSLISPVVSALPILCVIVVGFGMHKAIQRPHAWSLPGFWVSCGHCGFLIALQIVMGVIAGMLQGGIAQFILLSTGCSLLYGVGAAHLAFGDKFFSRLSPHGMLWPQTMWAFGTGMAVALVNLWILQHVSLLLPADQAVEILGNQLAAQSFFWLLIFMCLFPSLGEEILFRGLLGRGLMARYGWVAGMVITSLLFALIHANLFQGISALILGLILHLVYLWTGSIWAPIALHFGNNMMAMCLTKFMFDSTGESSINNQGDWFVPTVVVVVSLQAAVCLMIAIRSSVREYVLPVLPESIALEEEGLETSDVGMDNSRESSSEEESYKEVIVETPNYVFLRPHALMAGSLGLITAILGLWQSYLERN